MVADLVLEKVSAKAGLPFMLGCPSGRTAMPVYAALARRASTGADLSTLTIVMMDDYVLPDGDGGFRVVDPDESYSGLRFARHDIMDPIARASAAAGNRPPTQIWTADPADPKAYDERIEAAGGIDLFLLASGDSDGHVAFNQPGTPRDAGTHIVELGEATRRDNMGTFPEFTHLDMVPHHGVTVGIDTIARLSASVVMILAGSYKRRAFARISAAHSYEPGWPATIVTECQDAALLVDRTAAALPV
ncbi:6-phosphogluconolactonase [Microbacterium sp.]|uniref:6-phosphogluconolactonase n=1 Tax=Microbacterium sp. TaxID=51671 RepID=UPI003A90AB9F